MVFATDLLNSSNNQPGFNLMLTWYYFINIFKTFGQKMPPVLCVKAAHQIASKTG